MCSLVHNLSVPGVRTASTWAVIVPRFLLRFALNPTRLARTPNNHPVASLTIAANLPVRCIPVAGGPGIGVPGEVSGYYAAWKKFGRLPWDQLVRPAIVLCEDGFLVESALARAIRYSESSIRKDSNLAYVH